MQALLGEKLREPGNHCMHQNLHKLTMDYSNNMDRILSWEAWPALSIQKRPCRQIATMSRGLSDVRLLLVLCKALLGQKLANLFPVKVGTCACRPSISFNIISDPQKALKSDVETCYFTVLVFMPNLVTRLAWVQTGSNAWSCRALLLHFFLLRAPTIIELSLPYTI